MTVRFAAPQDKEQVLALFDEFSRLFQASDVPSRVGGDMYDEVVSRKDTMIFVCEEDAKLLGLATFYLLPNIRHGWRRGHIEDFFTTEAARGKGVGTQIFSAIKEHCRQNKIKVIKLDSEKSLVRSHRFYEKNGGKHTENMFRFDIT